MSAPKSLLIKLSTVTQGPWDELMGPLDDFKAGQGQNVQLEGTNFLSCERLPALIKEILDRGMSFDAKITISAGNYQDLTKIVLFLKKQGVQGICFSYMQVSGISAANYHLLVPTKQMFPSLLEAIKLARAQGLLFNIENLPLCVIPGLEDHILPSNYKGIKMQFCNACNLKEKCGGISKTQIMAEYGTQLLSWQFLFPKDFFTEEDIAFLDEELLKSSDKG